MNFADTSSWLRSLGTAGVEPALLDPLNTSTGALTLLAIQSERQKTSASDTAVSGLIVPLAQRLGSMAKPYTDVNSLFGRAAADGSQVVVPASEQSFVKYQEGHPDAQLKASYRPRHAVPGLPDRGHGEVRHRPGHLGRQRAGR